MLDNLFNFLSLNIPIFIMVVINKSSPLSFFMYNKFNDQYKTPHRDPVKLHDQYVLNIITYI